MAGDVVGVGEGDADVVEAVRASGAGSSRRAGTRTDSPMAGASSVLALDVDGDLQVGSASIGPQQLLAHLGADTMGTRPFLVALFTKMAEARRDHGLEPVLLDGPHGVLAADEPVPKLGPATGWWRPAYCSWLSTKSRSSRHSEKRPFSKPVRSTA
jgi:hypothetical protein